MVEAAGWSWATCEIIVVDGLSTDNTQEKLALYGDQIRVIREPDKGQYDAINKGFEVAHGRYHAWLNSDDRFMPGALKLVQSLFDNNPRLEWLSGGILREYHEYSTDIESKNPSLIQYMAVTPGNKRTNINLTTRDFLLAKAIIHQSSTFWRATLSQKSLPAHSTGKLLDQLYYALDYEFWVRLSRQAECRLIPQILSINIVHSQAKTGVKEGMMAYHDEADSVRYKYFGDWMAKFGFQPFIKLTQASYFKSADRFVVRLLNKLSR
jgi:glycosyltransferase involved in cell wall biosynthesis